MKMLADNVLVTEVPTEEKSSGGIILNSTTQTVQTAIVVEVSDGFIGGNGELIKLNVNRGDKVLINNGAGQKIRLDGTDYHLVRESEILMVI